jgi:DNA-binding CsgD family transcriptional regulator
MKLTDIIPLINEGKTTKQIAQHFNLSIPTVFRYKKMLRDRGYTFQSKNGRPFKAI